MWKKLSFFGMPGAFAYVFHVVLGGFLWKGYNHLHQPISDLTGQGAPDRALLVHITNLYSLFSILFAIGILMYFKKAPSGLLKAGLVLFLCMHIVSLSYAFFPEDFSGSKASFTGSMHLVVTFAIVPLTILFPIFVGLGIRQLSGYERFSAYSIVTGIILFLAGGTSAMLFAQKLPYFGLAERINIGTLQLWMFVTSWMIFFGNAGKKAEA